MESPHCDEAFEAIEYPPPNSLGMKSCKSPKQSLSRNPLTQDTFTSFLDSDGRLVDEHGLRMAIFKGGVDPDVREEVWHYLFGLYPFHSTVREREILLAEHHVRYEALKHRWKNFLETIVTNSDDIDNPKLLNPGYLKDIPEDESMVPPTSPDPEIKQQIQFMAIQAQVHAGRQTMDVESLKKSIRIIDKDVPRTDRTEEYFRGNTVHLRHLREALITYAAFNPDVGYAQGMNDIISRFFTVFDSEVKAYWCFKMYMEHMKSDFLEDGVLNKLKLTRLLLNEVDKDMTEYLDFLQIGDMTFCHRWMLLGFKREFALEDSLRCFEILSSRHLELSSLEAEKVIQQQRRKDFETEGGESRGYAVTTSTEFTFEVFMCVAILIQYRKEVFDCTDTSDIFALVSSLSMKLNLDVILQQAELLFIKYCQKSVEECFTLLEPPSPDISTSKTVIAKKTTVRQNMSR